MVVIKLSLGTNKSHVKTDSEDNVYAKTTAIYEKTCMYIFKMTYTCTYRSDGPGVLYIVKLCGDMVLSIVYVSIIFTELFC